MAQNDIIDLDELINQGIDLNTPIPTMQQVQPEPIAGLPYLPTDMGGGAGNLIPNDVKNFLVEKGLPRESIDLLLGAPNSFRDRAVNLNPMQIFKGGNLGRLFTGLTDDEEGVMAPAERGNQKFGFTGSELTNPSDSATKAAQQLGVNTEKGAPFRVQMDSAYLPRDQFEYGSKRLLLEAYPNATIPELNIRKEPNNDRLVYTDPDTGEVQYINPPGVDRADIQKFMEPLVYDISGALIGLGAGTVASTSAGAGVGGLSAFLLTDPESSLWWKAGTTTAGATAGALSAPLTFSVAGESLAHYFWKHSNLRGLRDRGILDPEIYDDDKIQQVAMKDARLTAVFATGGNAAFRGLASMFNMNPATVGIDDVSFLKNFKILEDIQKGGSKAEKDAVSRITSPQVLALGDEVGPERLGALQTGVDRVVARNTNIENELLESLANRNKGYATLFEEFGSSTNNMDALIPTARLKANWGGDIIEDLGPASQRTATDEKAMINNIKSLNKDNDPEGLFSSVWQEGKISKLDTLLKMMPEEKIGVFKNLVYRDFLENVSSPEEVVKYIAKHGDGLTSMYGKEFTEGLIKYNKLAKRLDIRAKAAGLNEDAPAKFITGMMRAYVGLFTREGRMITGFNQLRNRSKEGGFARMLLEPEQLLKNIESKRKLTGFNIDELKRLNPDMDEGELLGQFLFGGKYSGAARIMSADYGRETFTPANTETPNIPTMTGAEAGTLFNMSDFDMTRDLDMNMGGNPLIELQYGYGEE